MAFETLLLLGGAAVAGFVQGLSGFAFGLVAMSFWVWGLPPATAAVMVVFGGLTGQLLSALSLPRLWQWSLLGPFLTGGLLGLPLGVALLPRLDAALFKLGLGAVLVVWCPLMLLSDRLPRVQRGGRLGDGLAGLAGGVMGGLGGFTGVVPSLWCTLRGFDKARQRSVLQNFNLCALAATMVAYLASGLVTRPMALQMPLVALALLLPSRLGARLYIGLSEAGFRRLVLALLSGSGVAMLASALPKVLA